MAPTEIFNGVRINRRDLDRPGFAHHKGVVAPTGGPVSAHVDPTPAAEPAPDPEPDPAAIILPDGDLDALLAWVAEEGIGDDVRRDRADAVYADAEANGADLDALSGLLTAAVYGTPASADDAAPADPDSPDDPNGPQIDGAAAEPSPEPATAPAPRRSRSRK